MKKNIYFFQWISDLGGADTRLKELIQLLSESNEYNLFSIPNDDFRLKEHYNVDFLKKHNVTILTWNTLPSKLDGYGIAFCNFRLFEEKWRIEKIKNTGLKFIWSNDMTWTTGPESHSIKNNLIDTVIFTSDFHKKILTNKNKDFLSIKSHIIPNYFHIENYLIKQQKYESLEDKFVIGKLSRPDEEKYSENFPLFYKKMPISNAHFRFMGWSPQLSQKYAWYNFDNSFDLLSANQEGVIQFLSQLDLYVFNCHHNYTENQSRSVIESQLLGIPCIVPNTGNFPKMIFNTHTGFVFNTHEECYEHIEKIYKDKNLYNTISNNATNISRQIWADKNSQLNAWKELFESL